MQQLLLTNKQEEDGNNVSVGAKNLLQAEKKKYGDYIRKTYADKISPELMSIHALRSRIKEAEKKEREMKQ